VLAGHVYVSPQIAARLAVKAARPAHAERCGIEQLTDRELQVLELMGHGLKPRQIAAELHLDIKTVETHRARIRQKLGLKNAREVLQYAIERCRNLG